MGIIISSILTAIDHNCRYRNNCEGNVYGFIQIATGLVMLVVAIISSILTCKATCCKTIRRGRVHYTSNHTHIQMPSLPTALEGIQQEDLPPSYDNVTGKGSKYQKF